MCLLGLAPFNRHWHVCTGAAGTGGIDGRMDVVRHIGADLILNCSGVGQLTARMSGVAALTEGETVRMQFSQARLHFLEGVGLAQRCLRRAAPHAREPANTRAAL